jgi:CubicO group peptidase (beta-lactamase class C family)
VWNYSSGTTVLLSHLWQQSVGGDSLLFPTERLFAPLGMSSAVLEADARGTLVGSSYLYATAQDWARFGQFLLQDGVWNGQRILPAGYVQHITTVAEQSKGQYGRGQIWRVGPGRDDDPTKNPDAENGLPSDTFWLAGHDGQTVAVMPSKQLVVVRMGLTPSALRYRPQAMIAAILKALP